MRCVTFVVQTFMVNICDMIWSYQGTVPPNLPIFDITLRQEGEKKVQAVVKLNFNSVVWGLTNPMNAVAFKVK